MGTTIEMAEVERYVIVADKGFYSNENIKKLKKNHLSYIIPLKRNSSLIRNNKEFSGTFMYNGKQIKYCNMDNGIYAYEDPVLKMEEENDYLGRMAKGKRSK